MGVSQVPFGGSDVEDYNILGANIGVPLFTETNDTCIIRRLWGSLHSF